MSYYMVFQARKTWESHKNSFKLFRDWLEEACTGGDNPLKLFDSVSPIADNQFSINWLSDRFRFVLTGCHLAEDGTCADRCLIACQKVILTNDSVGVSQHLNSIELANSSARIKLADGRTLHYQLRIKDDCVSLCFRMIGLEIEES